MPRSYQFKPRATQPDLRHINLPPQPEIQVTEQHRPAEIPNPQREGMMQSYAPPPPPRPVNPETETRLVNEADLDELMEWGLPRYQEIYPRCTEESVRPLLSLACRGGRMRFLRTPNACSLFIAETTAWEPMSFVYQVFVVARVSSSDSPKEAYRLIRDSRRWAEQIRAVGFEFGRGRCSVNLRDSKDFLTRLSAIVPDQKTESWIKVLRAPPQVTGDIPPGVRKLEMMGQAPP